MVKPKQALPNYNPVEMSDQLSELRLKQGDVQEKITELRLKQTEQELRATSHMLADDEQAIAQVKQLQTNTISVGVDLKARLEKNKKKEAEFKK